ncbi:MAG TPA: addiction module protein [Rhodanobacteraceae bacterium]|nr:addiction module protein [Rhodanobacteraceae bacterium]
MNAINLDSVRQLPVSERIKLVEAIWESVAQDTADIELPAWQADELDRRMAEFESNPTEGEPWAEVKRRILREG